MHFKVTPSQRSIHRRNAVVLSIRPTYVDRILAGLKTVELRRRFPKACGHANVFLYSTSPVQAIVGHAVVEEVSQLSLQALWRRFARAAAVTREEFDTYFMGTETGCALHLTKVRALDVPIRLADLARRFEFSPPQSYCYWKGLSTPSAHDRVKISPRR
jgi:predicted transcriptional regulator